MAVTQISRIQVRRGRKLSPAGIPQLASGEIAWAVDSQELFIGNGSVQEGAPYVGNTKILTEHDNILALISSYKFGGADAESVVPFSIARSFQSKLDEYVSMFDFGAVGDGVTDNADIFETAFSQLFQNTIETYRKVLIIPNGDYYFDRDVRVPSYVELMGETQHGVTLKFKIGTGFKFVEAIGGNETLATFTQDLRPQYVKISNLQIETAQSDLSGAKNVVFDKVIFKGDYDTLISPELFPQDLPAGLLWNNTRAGFETTDIRFNSCEFVNTGVALRCNQTTVSETKVKFHDCKFDTLDTGLLLVGVKDQINKWRFSECRFSNTANHAVYVSNGVGMLIRECDFVKCGNLVDGTPAVPSVYFGQAQNNLLIDCTSDRQQSNGVTTSEIETYVPEVYGADRVTFLTRNRAFIEISEAFTPIAVFSAFNDYMDIKYSIQLETGDIRNGVMRITVNKSEGVVDLTDDYNYSSPLGVALGYQANTFLEIKSFVFGRLFQGSVISGENISNGTRVVQVNPGTIDLVTGLGTYNVDRLPIVDPTVNNIQTDEKIINFTRDTMTNIQFRVRLADNDNDDSSVPEAILLEYRQLSATRGSPGTISFDVSYGKTDF
jgi:hypothetical protein